MDGRQIMTCPRKRKRGLEMTHDAQRSDGAKHLKLSYISQPKTLTSLTLPVHGHIPLNDSTRQYILLTLKDAIKEGIQKCKEDKEQERKDGMRLTPISEEAREVARQISKQTEWDEIAEDSKGYAKLREEVRAAHIQNQRLMHGTDKKSNPVPHYSMQGPHRATIMRLLEASSKESGDMDALRLQIAKQETAGRCRAPAHYIPMPLPVKSSNFM